MGQFPRKCKLRGPSRVTSRYPAGTLYISPGPNCENPANFFSSSFSFFSFFFSREASMKSEKREKKNENRKMKTPVYDGEEGKISPLFSNLEKIRKKLELEQSPF